MLELQHQEFIKKSTGNEKKGFCYEVLSMEEYEQLQSRISNVLDKVLEEVHSSEEVQKDNELLKAKKVSKKG